MNINQLYRASFKGVRFLVSGELTTEGGRKTALHEYPKSDERFIEDLGLLEKSFNLTAVITGSNYKADKQALIKALEDPAVGVLVHPFLGSVNVKALPYSISEDMTKIGEANFTLSFKISSKNIQPVASSNFSLSSLVNGVISGVEAFLADSWLVNVAQNYQLAESLLTDVSDTFADLSLRLGAGAEDISGLTRSLSDFRNNLNSLILSGGGLALAVTSLFNNTANIVTTPLNSLNLFNGLFGFSGGYEREPTTAARRQALLNQNAIETTMGVNSLAYAYQFGVLVDYSDNEQLKNIYDSLEAQYSSLIENVNEEILYNLQTLRNQYRQQVEIIEINVSKIVEITVNPQPLTALCYTLYGNLDNYQRLIDLNGIINPASVSGTLRVLTA